MMDSTNRRTDTITPAYGGFGFLYDLDFANYHFPWVFNIASFFFFFFMMFFAIINPLIVNDQIYEESKNDEVIAFRSLFGPTVDTDPETIITMPTFYILFVLDIIMFFTYFVLIYYQFTLYMPQVMQFLVYFISSWGFLLTWFFLVNFSASLMLSINNVHPYAIAYTFMSLFGIPGSAVLFIKCCMEVRLGSGQVISTNVPMTIEWLTLCFSVIVLQEINNYSYKKEPFKVFVFAFQTVIALYTTVKTLRHPHFQSCFVHCLSITISTISTVSSFIGMILFFVNYVSLTNQIIIYIVFSIAAVAALSTYVTLKWKKAEKVIRECDVIHPADYDFSFLSYITSALNPVRDQDKVPISIIDELKEHCNGNTGMLIRYLAFKLVDRECHPIIQKEATTLILSNSGSFINTIKLKTVMAFAGDDIISDDNYTMFSKRRFNILLVPCYRDISNFWRAAVTNNMSLIKASLFSLSSNIRSYKHFFNKDEEFKHIFHKTISLSVKDLDDSEFSDDVVERCERADKYGIKPADSKSLIVRICVILTLLFSLILPFWIDGKAASHFNDLNKVFKSNQIQESLMKIATAIDEYVFKEHLDYEPLYNLTKDELKKYLKNSFNELSKIDDFSDYINQSAFDDLVKYSNEVVDSEIEFFNATSPFAYATGNLTRVAKNIAQEFGKLSDKRKATFLEVSDDTLKIFKLMSIILSVFFVVLELIMIICYLKGNYIIDKICWQPMLIEKNKSIDMMNYYTKLGAELDAPPNSAEFFRPFTRLSIIIANAFTIPLSIVLSYALYSFVEKEMSSFVGASRLGLANSLIFTALSTITSSIASDCDDPRINVVLENVTSYLLDLTEAFTGSYSLESSIQGVSVNATSSEVAEYKFDFPHLVNSYDDDILASCDDEILGNLTSKLFKLALRSQSISVKLEKIPYQIMYSGMKIAMQTTQYMNAFNAEMKKIVGEVDDLNIFSIIAVNLLFVIVALIIFVLVIEVTRTIADGLVLVKRMIACVPDSKFFADDGYQDFQPPPKSISPILIDALPNGIIFFNSAGVITHANPAAIEMYGEIEGENVSILRPEIVDANGMQRHITLKKFDPSSFPTGYFDEPIKDNFIIATDTTGLRNVEMKVNMLKREIQQNFTLPALMKENHIFPMQDPIILDVVIDENASDNNFSSLSAAIREEAYNCQCIFHIDTQRWSCYMIFYSVEESLKRTQQKEAITFAVFITQMMAKFDVPGKVGLAVIPQLTAIVDNSIAPRIFLMGSDVWKAAFLTRFGYNGEIVAEKSVSKVFATSNVELVRSGNAKYGDESIDYIIMRNDESSSSK